MHCAYLADGDAEGILSSDEVMIPSLATTSPVSAPKWQLIRQATAEDPTVQSVRQCLAEG